MHAFPKNILQTWEREGTAVQQQHSSQNFTLQVIACALPELFYHRIDEGKEKQYFAWDFHMLTPCTGDEITI